MLSTRIMSATLSPRHASRHCSRSDFCAGRASSAGGVPRDQPLAAVGELMEPVEAVLRCSPPSSSSSCMFLAAERG